jgi:hypothetical protein
VASKVDAANSEKLAKLKRFAKRKKLSFHEVSAVTGSGIDALEWAMANRVEAIRRASSAPETAGYAAEGSEAVSHTLPRGKRQAEIGGYAVPPQQVEPVRTRAKASRRARSRSRDVSRQEKSAATAAPRSKSGTASRRNCVATEYGEEPGSKAAKAVMISHSRLLKNRFHADDAATPCSLHMLLIPAVAPRLICPTTRNNGACRGPRLPTPSSHKRACRGPRLPTPTSHKRACRGPRLPTPTSHKRACRGPRLPTPTSHKRACRGPRLRRVFPQPVRPMKYAVGRDLTRYLPEHS